MASDSWLNGWALNDIVSVSEFAKGMGCVFDTTLGSSATIIDTGAILPTTYAAMLIEFTLRSDRAAASDSVGVKFNNDSGGNYDNLLVTADGTTVATSLTTAQTSGRLGACAAATATAGLPGVGWAWIPGYGGTVFEKLMTSRNGFKTSAAAPQRFDYDCWWRSTAAINRVAVFPVNGTNFITGSRLTIYVAGS